LARDPDAPVRNAEVDAARVTMTEDARKLTEQAAARLNLSPRGYTRVVRVARSIADLGGAAAVRRQDVAEALAFRSRVPGRALV